jgi:RNA polymerase sigma factor (sigma-70 family)
MDASHYSELRRRALRLTRSTAEAEDLVQDTLLAALLAGRDDPAWLAGVMRRRALMMARSEGRRQRRHAQADAAGTFAPPADEELVDADARIQLAPFIRALPRALRQVLVLALHGLETREIRWLLRLSPTAFRQRLTGLRKAIARWPEAAIVSAEAALANPDWRCQTDLATGLMRPSLRAAMSVSSVLGTHDPDGHLLLIGSVAHTSGFGGNKGGRDPRAARLAVTPSQS